MMNNEGHIQTKRKQYDRDLGQGVKLRAEVSPCVFMYESYPLQMKITLHLSRGESLGDAYAADRTRTASSYTKADVERLLDCVRIMPCPRCSAPAFDPATVETNRGGICEKCFLNDLNAEYRAEVEAEQRKLAARDRRMKKKGMAVRVSAWVHPEAGDDYQVDWYYPYRPTSVEVRRRLLQAGSSVVQDYDIVGL